MLHVSTPLAWLEGKRCIRTYEHSNTARTTGRTGVALLVKSDISGANDSVTTIPGRGLHPIDCIKERVGTPITSVDSVHSFNVGVADVLEQLHED